MSVSNERRGESEVTFSAVKVVIADLVITREIEKG